MAAKPGSNKKSGSTRCKVDAAEMDRQMAELKKRVAVLENELRLKQEDASTKGLDERKRAEEALLESEERFRNVFENAATGILIADVHRGYLAVNDRFCEITGYSREQLLTMGCGQIVHPDDQAEDIAEVQRLLRGEAKSFIRDLRYVHASGATVWARVNVSLMRIYNHDEPRIVAVVEDITERKQAEKALSSSQQMLQMVMDNIPQAVFWKDRNFVLIGCNKVLAAAAGLGKPEDIRGKTDYDLPWSREQADFFRECDRRIMENDRPEYHIIEQQREFDGRNAWVETSKVPLHDANGTVIGILGTYEDITERKQAEEALRESEEKYRGLVEQVNDWVWEIDANGVYTYASPRVCELLGYEPGEVVGTTPFDYMAPDEAGRVKALFAPLLSEPREFLLLENTLVKKEGGTVTVETSGVPIYDDQHNFSGYRGIDRDITERKRAEEALSFERSQLLSIFDSIDDVVYVTDPYTYEVLYANKAMKEKFGGDLVGGVCYREFQKRDSPCDFCTNSIILKDKGTPYRWEYYNPTVGRYFMITDRIIRWPDGRDVRFEIAKDITERKRAEEASRDAKQQAELYLDLMGHDINNMHQIALGYLELALGMPPGVQLDEMIGKSVEVLQRSTQLIRNVRKLQKVNEDFRQMHEVDVGGVLHTVRREFGAVPDKNVRLNLNCEEHCFVRANELLHDVFANLVGNAIKHTGDKADINIDLDIVNDNGGKYCRVSVEDNGPGITDNFKGVIFNRMLKGTNKSKGMGLGLYLVKSLVDSYGGRVWVEDRVIGDHTKGARFVVMLPAVDK